MITESRRKPEAMVQIANPSPEPADIIPNPSSRSRSVDPCEWVVVTRTGKERSDSGQRESSGVPDTTPSKGDQDRCQWLVPVDFNGMRNASCESLRSIISQGSDNVFTPEDPGGGAIAEVVRPPAGFADSPVNCVPLFAACAHPLPQDPLPVPFSDPSGAELVSREHSSNL